MLTSHLPARTETACIAETGADKRVLRGALWQSIFHQPCDLHEQVRVYPGGFYAVLHRRIHIIDYELCGCSGPVMALVLAKENAIAGWRALIGPTDSEKARETVPNRCVGCHVVENRTIYTGPPTLLCC